jgi:hypothetical protein
MMEALCGTSSLGLDPVTAIEASYAKNGEFEDIHPSVPHDFLFVLTGE